MKKVLLTILLSLSIVIVQSQNWLDKVVVRIDNDYVSFFDTVSRRVEMPKRIKDEIENYFLNIESADSSENLVFCTSYANVDIYIVKFHSLSSIGYYFWGYDKSTDKLSKKPYRINGKWIESNEYGFSRKLITPPLIEFTSEIANGYDFILRERSHNGTSYNAVIDHYVSMDNNMNLEVIFCVESVFQYISPEITENSDAVIYRLYKYEKVKCYLKIDDREEKHIGDFEIDMDNQRIKNKNVLDLDYEDYLITGSGIDEILFTKKGQVFEY